MLLLLWALSSTFALFWPHYDTSDRKKIGSFLVEFGYTPKCSKPRQGSSHADYTPNHSAQKDRSATATESTQALPASDAGAASASSTALSSSASSQASRRVAGALTSAFTRPTEQRFAVLLFAAILTTGSRTILNLLRTADVLAGGHPSSYHRVLSRRRWSTAALARAWTGYVLKRWLPTGTVLVAGDDTVFEHRGKKVYGKGRHRDAVRSSHSYTAYRYGHKWVVLAILVPVPWSNRPWALPVLCALYRTPDWNKQHGRPHKTPAQIMRQLLAVLLHWFPERRFQFVGDGNFGTHDLTAFAHRHRRRLALVSRFYPDANLYDLPATPTTRKKGRPRSKGRKLPTPEQVVKRTKLLKNLNVAWYGGGRRDIAVATGTAHWYRAGDGLTPVRWVYVKDRTGTHRDEYFFTSDPDRTPQQIVEAYTALEYRNHLPGNAGKPESRQDPGLDGEDGVANDAVLDGPVWRRDGDLRGVAGEVASSARRWPERCGQRDIRRHPGFGAPLVVERMVFCEPRASRRL